MNPQNSALYNQYNIVHWTLKKIKNINSNLNFFSFLYHSCIDPGPTATTLNSAAAAAMQSGFFVWSGTGDYIVANKVRIPVGNIFTSP